MSLYKISAGGSDEQLIELCTILSRLENMQIPRWMALRNDYLSLELHGFSGAATKTYEACKTLDAPISIFQHLFYDCKIQANPRANPSRYQMFMENRISKVHRLTKNETWRHDEGIENQADGLSRGVSTDCHISTSKLAVVGRSKLVAS